MFLEVSNLSVPDSRQNIAVIYQPVCLKIWPWHWLWKSLAKQISNCSFHWSSIVFNQSACVRDSRCWLVDNHVPTFEVWSVWIIEPNFNCHSSVYIKWFNRKFKTIPTVNNSGRKKTIQPVGVVDRMVCKKLLGETLARKVGRLRTGRASSHVDRYLKSEASSWD